MHPPEGVPPPPEPTGHLRGVAADNRRERRRLLQRLAGSVLTGGGRRMSAAASQATHRAEQCHDCSPEHDLDRVARLVGAASGGEEASVPVWVERAGRHWAEDRAAEGRGPKLGHGGGGRSTRLDPD